LENNVLALANQLLLFVVFFLIFDASQSTAMGALRGYKDTRIPMLLALFSFWVVGLPLECALGFGWFGEPMGVYGFWTGLFCSVATASVLITARLWYVSGSQKTIQRLSFRSINGTS
jgi:MATE family multidrug resistance protein